MASVIETEASETETEVSATGVDTAAAPLDPRARAAVRGAAAARGWRDASLAATPGILARESGTKLVPVPALRAALICILVALV